MDVYPPLSKKKKELLDACVCPYTCLFCLCASVCVSVCTCMHTCAGGFVRDVREHPCGGGKGRGGGKLGETEFSAAAPGTLGRSLRAVCSRQGAKLCPPHLPVVAGGGPVGRGHDSGQGSLEKTTPGPSAAKPSAEAHRCLRPISDVLGPRRGLWTSAWLPEPKPRTAQPHHGVVGDRGGWPRGVSFVQKLVTGSATPGKLRVTHPRRGRNTCPPHTSRQAESGSLSHQPCKCTMCHAPTFRPSARPLSASCHSQTRFNTQTVQNRRQPKGTGSPAELRGPASSPSTRRYRASSRQTPDVVPIASLDNLRTCVQHPGQPDNSTGPLCRSCRPEMEGWDLPISCLCQRRGPVPYNKHLHGGRHLHTVATPPSPPRGLRLGCPACRRKYSLVGPCGTTACHDPSSTTFWKRQN